MRWWTKTLIWAGILLVCAAGGVVVAIVAPDLLVRDVPHADPPPVTSSPEPSGEVSVRWTLRLAARSEHTYRVGGSCRSDWRMRTRILVTAAGGVRGTGLARLQPGAGCDFPSAQVQARSLRLRIFGRRAPVGLRLRLRFREVGARPAGAQDLGGFRDLLGRFAISVGERPGGRVRVSARAEGPEDEFSSAVIVVRLSR